MTDIASPKISIILPCELGPELLRHWEVIQDRRTGFTQSVAQARDDVQIAIFESEGKIAGLIPFHSARETRIPSIVMNLAGGIEQYKDRLRLTKQHKTHALNLFQSVANMRRRRIEREHGPLRFEMQETEPKTYQALLRLGLGKGNHFYKQRFCTSLVPLGNDAVSNPAWIVDAIMIKENLRKNLKTGFIGDIWRARKRFFYA